MITCLVSRSFITNSIIPKLGDFKQTYCMVFFEASTTCSQIQEAPSFLAKADASEPEVLVNTIYFMTMSASKHSLQSCSFLSNYPHTPWNYTMLTPKNCLSKRNCAFQSLFSRCLSSWKKSGCFLPDLGKLAALRWTSLQRDLNIPSEGKTCHGSGVS